MLLTGTGGGTHEGERRYTQRELVILMGLGEHTRAHARALVAEHPGLSLTSGRRTAARNSAVGGSPGSYHLRGRAVDLVGPSWDLQQAASTARRQRLGAACTGPEEVLLEKMGRPGMHLHVAW